MQTNGKIKSTAATTMYRNSNINNNRKGTSIHKSAASIRFDFNVALFLQNLMKKMQKT